MDYDDHDDDDEISQCQLGGHPDAQESPFQLTPVLNRPQVLAVASEMTTWPTWSRLLSLEQL